MILAQFLLYISILGFFPRRKSGSYGLKNRLKEALYSKAGIAVQVLSFIIIFIKRKQPIAF